MSHTINATAAQIKEMLEYYEKKGCEVKPLVEYVNK